MSTCASPWKWALDREDIAKKVFLGHASPGNDNPIAPAIKFAIDPQPAIATTRRRPSSICRGAGLSSLKVDLSVADAAFNGAIDAAVLFQEHAKAAGSRSTSSASRMTAIGTMSG